MTNQKPDKPRPVNVPKEDYIKLANEIKEIEEPVESLDSILAKFGLAFHKAMPSSVGGHREIRAASKQIRSLIQTSNREAIEAYVENQYGKRCKTKDTHDFPELKDDPLANRCLTCQAWEDFDEYFKDKDEKENTL